MGSFVELNDTLQITVQQGFPAGLLDVGKHRTKPIALDSVKDKVFEFRDKPGARIYHQAPTRVFLVHNLDGKWIYWGTIIVLEQTIAWDGKNYKTSGKYRITKIYSPEYQEQVTKNDTSPGKSYF